MKIDTDLAPTLALLREQGRHVYRMTVLKSEGKYRIEASGGKEI